MQRFGRKAVYIVIGDGVEEEQGAKKVLLPSRGRCRSSPEPSRVSRALSTPAAPSWLLASHLHIAAASRVISFCKSPSLPLAAALAALDCFWDDCSEQETLSGQAGGAGPRVLYLILTDRVFQEPSPVNKGSIRLMRKKAPHVISGPGGEGPGAW